MALPQVVLQFIKEASDVFIRVQKRIEFHLPYTEVLQLSPR